MGFNPEMLMPILQNFAQMQQQGPGAPGMQNNILGGGQPPMDFGFRGGGIGNIRNILQNAFQQSQGGGMMNTPGYQTGGIRAPSGNEAGPSLPPVATPGGGIVPPHMQGGGMMQKPGMMARPMIAQRPPPGSYFDGGNGGGILGAGGSQPFNRYQPPF